MIFIPITWVFKIKPIDRIGRKFLYKARSCIRGVYQISAVDFDPYGTYELVACHEATWILLSHAAAHDLILGRWKVANAYLYRKNDWKVFMEQPKDSTIREERPGFVCRLEKSIYGIRQVEKIWGSSLLENLLKCGFKISTADCRFLFLIFKQQHSILCGVLDDLAFAPNITSMLNFFKDKLSATFDASSLE